MIEEPQGRYADTTTVKSNGSGTWPGESDRAARSGSAASSVGRWTGGVDGARGLIRARWRWITLIALVVIASAAALSWSRTPTYVSSADVLVQPQIIAKSTTPLEPDMGTELALAQSTAIRDIAASRLNVDPAGLTGLSASVPLNTHVVHFAYTAGDAREAMLAAQAFADAYVDYGIAQVHRTGPRSPTPTVITRAVTPSAPASPNHGVDVGVAAIVGLVLGLGAAWLRDRFDDRPRSETDLEQATGLPVLAVIPRMRSTLDPAERLHMLSAPASPAAAPLHDLRRLIRRLADQDRARTLLVTGVRSTEHVQIAADLAVALAQSYRRVVLVDVGLGGAAMSALRPEPASHLVDAVPGLDAEVSNTVADTVVPGLLMLTLSPEHLAGDDTALRRVFRQLRATADFVVVAGPDATTADIGGFAESVDLTVLVVDSRHSTRTRVRAALARLNRFENCVVGTVLIGTGRSVTTERSAAASSGRPEPSRADTTAAIAKEI